MNMEERTLLKKYISWMIEMKNWNYMNENENILKSNGVIYNSAKNEE